MTTTETEQDVIRRVLANCTTWAVVGLGDNPRRAAYGVAAFLQRHGKRIVPVHPVPAEVLGERTYPRLADIPFPVDCVDVFRRSSAAGAVADEAIAVGAKAVWFQLDVIDDDAAERVRAAGMDMVMDRCPKIEWPDSPTSPAPLR